MTKARTSKEAAALIAALNKIGLGVADARIAMMRLGDTFTDANRAVMALAYGIKEAHHQARLIALAQDDRRQMDAIMKGYLVGLAAEAVISVDDYGQMDGVVIRVFDEKVGLPLAIGTQRCEKGDNSNAVTIKLCEGLIAKGYPFNPDFAPFNRDLAIDMRLNMTGMFTPEDIVAIMKPGATDLDLLTCPASALIKLSSLATPPISE